MTVHTDTWKSVLSSLSSKIKKTDFLVWFQDTNIVALDDKSVTIGLPSIFAEEWFKKKYATYIRDSLKELNLPVNVNFKTDSSLVNEGGVDLRTFFNQVQRKPRKVSSVVSQQQKSVPQVLTSNHVVVPNSVRQTRTVNMTLNPKYSLDNFVVGSNSRLAHAACCAVAKNPGMAYNPLFIYGDVGLGKTHLLQATGNAICQRPTSNYVAYVTAEKFTNEIVESIKKNSVRAFRNKYRHVDCLIIDDIQFLAGKGRTQEEFFHTFNELYHANKQVIISSDKTPKDLSGVESRLVSRFEMGMIVDVTFPDYETCLAILLKKAADLEVLIPSDVLEFIASNVHSSIRELEGVLVQVVAQSQLEGVLPSIQSVSKLLAKLGKLSSSTNYQMLQENRRSFIQSPDEVIDLVADYFNLTRSDIVGSKRSRDIMVPRQICIYVLRNDYNYSFEKIGTLLGGRNHTTAMHAYNKVKRQLRKDHKLLQNTNEIRKLIGL
jgi:chromosomal replication initiator protein